MKFLTLASAVLAIHLTLLAFFFFKPTVNYFMTVCASTILVWAAIFHFKRGRRLLIGVGVIVQLCVQRFAYTSWMPDHSSFWWALAQFLGLQYLVVLSLSRPSADEPSTS